MVQAEKTTIVGPKFKADVRSIGFESFSEAAWQGLLAHALGLSSFLLAKT